MNKTNEDSKKLMSLIMENYIQIVNERMENAKKRAGELTVEEMYELNDDVRMLGHIKRLQSEAYRDSDCSNN